MGIMLAELKRGCILRERIQLHLEEIYREFTVDVMEFIFVFSVVFGKVFFINFFEVVKIVRTFWIHTFVNNEMLSFLFGSQGVEAVRTSDLYRCITSFFRIEFSAANLAQELPF